MSHSDKSVETGAGCMGRRYKRGATVRKLPRMKRERTSLVLIALSCTLAFAASEEMQERKGFFWGGSLGAGYVERTFSVANGIDDETTRFYMDGFGGYAFNPHIAIGFELSGWLIEPDSDTYTWNPYWPPDNEPSENPAGEGISQIFVFTRLYPYRTRNLFIKVGGGYVDHWLKTQTQYINDEGWGTVVGVGYDIPLSGNWSLTPLVSYSYGETQVQTLEAFTASFGFTWHQWKGPVLGWP